MSEGGAVELKSLRNKQRGGDRASQELLCHLFTIALSGSLSLTRCPPLRWAGPPKQDVQQPRGLLVAIPEGRAAPLSTIVPGRHLLPLVQCGDGLRKCPEGKLIPSLSLGNAKSHMKGEWKRSVTDHTRAAESRGTEQQRNPNELGPAPLSLDSKRAAAGSSHPHFLSRAEFHGSVEKKQPQAGKKRKTNEKT
ncbi:hypothetical protein QTP86_007768 [Hemibagrus guttatus]|nr:hypothetical protein QTP86_007768 [Hemibagrus guttatus]